MFKMIRVEPAQGLVCPSIKLVCSTYIVCRCIVFHRSCLLKNLQPEKTQSLKSRRSSFPSLLNEFATLSFGGIERFLGLFSINPWKLTRKVDRRKDTLEFSRADFSTLQTKSIDGQKRPSIRFFFHQICAERIPRMLFKIGLSRFLFQRFGLSRFNPIFFPRAKIVPELAQHACQRDHSGKTQEMSIRPEWCPAIWSALGKLMFEQQAEVLTTFGKTPKMLCVQYSFTNFVLSKDVFSPCSTHYTGLMFHIKQYPDENT